MEYRYIGKSGLRVSVLSLGTMTFGSFTDEKEALKILDRCYDEGINFIDTAELYPVPPDEKYAGLTEIILGKWLKTKPRESIILASKVAGASSGWFIPPIRHGLTAIDRFHIKKAVEGSLKRLQTDYIDLYQIHWPDTIVPIDEALEVFDELIKEGKIRYIGTSNDNAYYLTKALMVSKYKNLPKFQSIQNNFSLLNPRFFDELELVCKEENISLLPYSPLAGGMLSGKYNQKIIPPNSRFIKYLNDSNSRVKNHAKKFYNKKTLKATELFLQISKKYELNPITLAIAYSKYFSFIASTIFGVSSYNQLEPIFDAVNIKLNRDILKDINQITKDIKYPMG